MPGIELGRFEPEMDGGEVGFRKKFEDETERYCKFNKEMNYRIAS